MNEFNLVTVTDILRRPKNFHEVECVDPDETLKPNAVFRAKIFRNESGLLVRSFRHGGGNFRLERTAIKLDLEDPIRLFEQIECVARTGSLPDIFVWGESLVHIGVNGTLRAITAVSAPIILGRLMSFYTLKNVKDDWVRVRAELPDRLVKAFLEKADWDLPKLTGMIHCPYFYGGEIVQTEGYNHKSGLYLSKNFKLAGIKNVSREDALKVVDYLKSVLNGFPFEYDVDLAVALALMVTAVQRATLEKAPMFGISACTPGSGKTQLATGCASLSNGVEASVHGFRDDEAELSKMLMAVLMKGDPHLILDNVKLGVALGGDALCAVLSSAVYAGRELGFSRIREVSTRILMIATGNNLKLDSDSTRRTLKINLDAKQERPELRSFDKTFVQICIDDREVILSAVLTILSAYHEAGSPKDGNVRLGSFERWSDQVCAPLVWLGVIDPVKGLALAESDAGVSSLGELLLIWRDNLGNCPVTTSEAMANPAVAAFFKAEFDDRNGATTRKVGNHITKYAGRIIDGCRLIKWGTRQRAVVWQFEAV